MTTKLKYMPSRCKILFGLVGPSPNDFVIFLRYYNAEGVYMYDEALGFDMLNIY